MLQSNSTSDHSMERTEEKAKKITEEQAKKTTEEKKADMTKETASKVSEGVQGIAYLGLTVIGSLILMGLVYYSLFYTEFL